LHAIESSSRGFRGRWRSGDGHSLRSRLERRFSGMIDRNHVRENETDFAVFGLNTREDKAID
jgi:hypothetical protein